MSHETHFDRISGIYDALYSREILEVLPAVLDRFVWPRLGERRDTLDLCCGSGGVTRFLFENACRVVGVDFSEKMLGYARKRNPEVKFFQADARSFSVARSFDLVLCAYSSLNYLESRDDVREVFSRVRDHLRPDGLFVFDLFSPTNEEEKLRTTYSEVTDGFVMTDQFQMDPDENRWLWKITAFTPNGSYWSREDHSIPMYTSWTEFVPQELESRGFRILNQIRAKADLGMKQAFERTFFIAGL